MGLQGYNALGLFVAILIIVIIVLATREQFQGPPATIVQNGDSYEIVPIPNYTGLIKLNYQMSDSITTIPNDITLRINQ